MDFHSFLDVDDIDDSLWNAGFFYAVFGCDDKGIISKPLETLEFEIDEMLSGDYQKRIHPDDRTYYNSLKMKPPPLVPGRT